jgi:hypothetical protein
MNRLSLTTVLFLSAAVLACGGADAPEAAPAEAPRADAPSEQPTDPEDDAHDADGHEHDEEPLGTARLGDLDIELAQGHGAVVPGGEGHLVVKLPYDDSGATVVRAWIGTEDRTLSYVGKGVYAPSHDDYDVHATAPDPLPEDARWWIEIEKPDGTRLTGSAAPILE